MLARTKGKVRAAVKIGLMNLTYNGCPVRLFTGLADGLYEIVITPEAPDS